MEDFNQLLERITDGWNQAKTTFGSDPSVFQSHAPGLVPEQIDEALIYLGKSLERKRAPNGYRPLYHVARIQLLNSLQALANYADNLQDNPTAHISGFLNALSSTISPLASLSLFQDKATLKETLTALEADLTQHIALLVTAQTSLADKNKDLDAALQLAEVIGPTIEKAVETLGEINANHQVSETAAQHCLTAQTSADQSIAEIKATSQSVEALELKLTEMVELTENQQRLLKGLTEQNHAQNKIIESILPNATAAGLSQSFAGGKDNYTISLYIWSGVFVAAILALCGIGIKMNLDLGSDVTSEKLLVNFLKGLPWSLPIVWLAWFAAVQYGNVLRVKEDYAFKEATALAFAGFRDHMQHLSTVNTSEGKNAMENLALSTIHNLGQEPLRHLLKHATDVTPFERLMRGIRPKNSDSK